MINKQFEAYKVKREIKRSGLDYDVYRNKVNEFKEKTGEVEKVVTFGGLYHEQSETIKITGADGTSYRNKKIPMILCLFDDVTLIKSGDIITINNKVFTVQGVSNINEWNIISDISLQVFDNGN